MFNHVNNLHHKCVLRAQSTEYSKAVGRRKLKVQTGPLTAMTGERDVGGSGDCGMVAGWEWSWGWGWGGVGGAPHA